MVTQRLPKKIQTKYHAHTLLWIITMIKWVRGALRESKTKGFVIKLRGLLALFSGLDANIIENS